MGKTVLLCEENLTIKVKKHEATVPEGQENDTSIP